MQREVSGETFLVPIRGSLADLQELYVLNEVGQWLWRRMDGSSTLDNLIAELAGEFEVDEDQARRDTDSFFRQLLEAGLVSNDEAGQEA